MLDTEISSPSTCAATSVDDTDPVAGFNVTSAPPFVTATMAGGVTATALADDDADAGALCVTVTVGAGFALPPPQADSKAR